MRALDRTKYLGPDEQARVLRHLEERAIIDRAKGRRVGVRDQALFMVALTGGLRATELTSLVISDLTFDRAGARLLVRKGKGGKSREVRLPRPVAGVLKSYLDWLERSGLPCSADAPMFPTRSGKTMSRSGAWRAWTKVLDRAGVEHRPLHAARHTAGTMLYRTTKDLVLVQKHLGHARSETTTIYAGVLDEDLQAGVNAAWPIKEEGP